MMPSDPQTRDELLHGDGIGERVQARPALILGIRHAKEAHRSKHRHDIAGEAALMLMLIDDGLRLAPREVAHRLAQQDMLRGKVKIHGRAG